VTTIVGLGGSLGAASTSLRALNLVLDSSAAAGARTRAFDVRALALPPYDPAHTQAPAAAVELADAVHAADGLVWSSPMYHGTVSGAFKNALDWLELLSKRTPAYLTNKPVGLVATAAGTQGLQAINTMDFAVRALRGWTVPLVVPIPRSHEGIDAGAAKQLALLGREVVSAARRLAPLPQVVA
jgi:FMN reductase